jgi:hypothetical protein
MKKRILNFIRASFLVDEKSSKNWVYIFMFLILSIIMISSSHSVDKKVFRIADLKEEMESFVKEKLSEKGIISSNTPPIKIIINVNK